MRKINKKFQSAAELYAYFREKYPVETQVHDEFDERDVRWANESGEAGLYVDAMDILIGGFPDFYDQEIRDIIRDNFDLLWGYDPDEFLALKVGAL
ncbi:hypothetical protein QP140_09135 [Corynebacterium sp. UMB9976]|uniref:hypothetical protein n=1 Tax=Corynebacterium sp. UMB9976 TaxID=3046354 RepID=UPI00254A90D2|nr:hypothetical protein [Corynebacterium sp. UMB9976]MDK6302743.1 hypothetical protein [Corynebacterium sp. UMB9976]